uniref:Uncharacterized protein n=1 Tax=Romanomermis culicivorax TaxID=13658 RepID=A0A915HZJ3_ROMCU
MDSLDYLNSTYTRRYKCCRGQMHVENGALVVATLELFLDCSIFLVLIADVSYGSVRMAGATFLIVMTLCLIHGGYILELYKKVAGLRSGGFTAGLIFYAQRRQKPLALVPHICAQIFVLIASLLVLLFCMAILALNYFTVGKESPSELYIFDPTDFRTLFSLFASCLAAVVQMWFLNIVVKLYRFLKAKNRYYRFLGRASIVGGSILDQQVFLEG